MRELRWPPRTEVGLGLAMVATYAVYQTLALPEPIPTAWLVVAFGLTLLSPLGGLTILAAIGPFTEALTDSGQITVVPYLLAALGAAVAIRVLVTRPLPRPNLPIVLAALLMVGTALGVLHSYLAYGDVHGKEAAELWVPSIGGAMTVLIAAAWVGWRKSVTPFFVAIASATTAAILSTANLETNGYLRQDAAIGWLLRSEQFGGRLTGVIRGADPAAVIFLIGFVGFLAFGILGLKRWWARLLPLAIAAICLWSMYLTLTRSALLGAAVAVAFVAIKWHRRAGLIAGVVLVGGTAASIPTGILRSFPMAVEQARIDVWFATIRLWLQNPILGAGLRSFEWLHANVGSPLLNAPHNEWLRLFAEEGVVVGLIGLAFAVVTPFVLARANSWVAATSGALAAGAFVAACFNNPFIYTQVNVALFTVIGIGLGVALAGVTRATSRAPSRGQTRIDGLHSIAIMLTSISRPVVRGAKGPCGRPRVRSTRQWRRYPRPPQTGPVRVQSPGALRP